MHHSSSNLSTEEVCCFGLFALCVFEVVCSGNVAILCGLLGEKKTCNTLLPKHWNVARGHSDVAVLSQFWVCVMLYIWYLSTVHFFPSLFPSLVLISCSLDLSFPSHTSSYLCFILSLIMALSIHVCPALSLSGPLSPLSHTSIKEAH